MDGNNPTLTRRAFLAGVTTTALAARAAGTVNAARVVPGRVSPNEKLDIALIGCGGQGHANLEGVQGQNVVALCDVDHDRAASALTKYPQAKRYHDYRKLLDDADTFNAVVVSTPDHTHAPASVSAMRLGKHCYCEKPLAHSIHEARVMAETAARYHVATQMGTQGMARDHSRKGIEMLRSGLLGEVTDVYVWTDRAPSHWPQGIERPADTPPVPPNLHWDLWLGTAPERPYHPAYHPFKWRGWIDFGTGALGDMGIHNFALAYLGLQLGAPTAVRFTSSLRFKETYPVWADMQFTFPARGDRPEVTMHWYDGGKKPRNELIAGKELDTNGCILVGTKGTLYAPGWAGDVHHLFPEDAFRDYVPPDPTLPRTPSHHQEWIEACKGGAKPLCNFQDFAAPITEVMLVGNLAILLGQNIEWDSAAMTVKGCPESEAFIHPQYRSGWEIEGLG
jgi:predicted dehydrogenase